MDSYLPENQFCFRRGRRTVQAMRNLAEDIDATLREPRRELYALFIDYTKAFDLKNWRT
jgi:hypothetical protein